MADFTYRPIDRLIVVRATVVGKGRRFHGNFILDTGASMTIISTDRVDLMGFSAQKDGIGFSNVQSPIGKESGYRVRLDAFEALGKKVDALEIACHDLGVHNIDGLIGMNFLEYFKFCIDASKHMISC